MTSVTVDVRRFALTGERGVIAVGKTRETAKLPGTAADIAVIRETMLRAGAPGHIPLVARRSVERGESVRFNSSSATLVAEAGVSGGQVDTARLIRTLSESLMLSESSVRRSVLLTMPSFGPVTDGTPALSRSVPYNSAVRSVELIREHAEDQVQTRAEASVIVAEHIHGGDPRQRAVLLYRSGVSIPAAAEEAGMSTEELALLLSEEH